jgi:WD40 repeat protein/serine/threonine protein kinase
MVEDRTLPLAGPVPALDALQVRVDGYEVLDVIGRGGMGVVYKARQLGVDRLVALKMLSCETPASSAVLERFQAEARAVGRLHHPNIIQVHDIGEQDGRPFLALEYVEGGSLAQWIDGRPQLPRAVARVVETLAMAIHYAHQQGIVHRDLKPANVLLSCRREPPASADLQKEDRTLKKGVLSSFCKSALAGGLRLDEYVPKITDFGLAKHLDGTTGSTVSGVVGTPAYMSPEQACGQSNEVGPASDIFALGAILYELLTGRPAFRADTPLQTLQRVVSEEPEPLARLQPGVPRDLQIVCLKCLRKDPRMRYSSAEALAEDLHRFRRGRLIRAQPTSWDEQLWGLVRRRLTIAILGTLAFGIGAVGFATTAWLWQEAERASQAAAAAQQQIAQHQTARAENQGPAAQPQEIAGHMHPDAPVPPPAPKPAPLAPLPLRRLDLAPYAHALAVARRQWSANNLLVATQLLLHCPAEERDWEWYYLHRLCHPALRTCRGHSGAIRCVAFSHDGHWLASAAMDRTIRIWDARRGQLVRTLMGHTQGVSTVAFSPDDKRLVSGAWDHALKVWDTATGQELLSWEGSKHLLGAVAFSPDGRRLAAASPFDVTVWDARTGAPLLHLPGRSCVAFSPDGRWLVAAVAPEADAHLCRAEVGVWDSRTGQETQRVAGHLRGVRVVAFSPDGGRLATGGEEGLVKIWELTTGQELRVARLVHSAVTSLAFSADGRHLAAGGGSSAWGIARLWETATGQEVAFLRSPARGVSSVTFDPGGRWLAFGSKEASGQEVVTIGEIGADPEAVTLRGDFTNVYQVAFSPDSRRLAGTCNDGTVHIWDPRDCRAPHPMLKMDALPSCLAFSPDGQCLTVSCGDRATIWDLATGKQRLALADHKGPFTCLAYQPDGGFVASGGTDGTVCLWDVATGRPGRTFTRGLHRLADIAFSPDGRLLAAATGEDSVIIWNTTTGREMFTLRTPDACFTRVAFSPDGQRIAAGGTLGPAGFVTIWHTATGQEAASPHRVASPVQALAFHPQGHRLAGAAGDTVRLWDVAGGQEVFVLPSHGGAVHSVRFSPDGCRLAGADGAGNVRVWDGTPLP